MQQEPETKLRLAWSSFFCGLGMVAFAALRIQHFFNSNYEVINGWKGSVCDVSPWLNCNSVDSSVLAQIGSIPLGYFGLMVGGLVCLGALFPSPALERTSRSVVLSNLVAVLLLFSYSAFNLHSFCLWDVGYSLFSILSFMRFRKRVSLPEPASFAKKWLRPSFKHLVTILVIFAVGAYTLRALQRAKRQATFAEQFFSLPTVKLPSKMSPYWVVRSTDRFQDATIRIVEFSDVICDNSKILNEALERLEHDFPGKMNVVFQFFPLETKCNHVVDKNKHPGACESALIAAYDPAKFRQIQDDFFANYYSAQKPEWRRELARRYGVEAAFTDPKTAQVVQDLIQTGTEYPPTSNSYPYGIRSVPTVILNERMIIGSLTYDQFHLICQAIVDQQTGKREFIESWYDRTNDFLSWAFRVLHIVT
jgi:uncharacterized membrane protein